MSSALNKCRGKYIQFIYPSSGVFLLKQGGEIGGIKFYEFTFWYKIHSICYIPLFVYFVIDMSHYHKYYRNTILQTAE